ncbi:hypothetical protein ACP70R_040732 [Stipagrostis hirtigluma subsp. patula]
MDAYPEGQPNPRADGGSVGDAFIWEMIGSRYTISLAEKVLRLRSAAYRERHKSGLSVWLENLEESTDDVAEQPPAYIVYNRIFLRGGGDGKDWYLAILKWLIGLPLRNISRSVLAKMLVKLLLFVPTKSLKKTRPFFRRNADEIAALCADIKVDQVRLGVACENNEMLAAALLCIDFESCYRGAYRPLLTDEDMSLSRKIEKRAIHVIQSVGEYSTAAAALVCIVKETELLFDLFEHEIDFPKMITLSKIIRQYAFMLMLYKGPESAAIAGALVGMAKEAKFMTYLLSGVDPICMEFDMCDAIREKASTALGRLLEEFLCKTPDNGDGKLEMAPLLVPIQRSL